MSETNCAGSLADETAAGISREAAENNRFNALASGSVLWALVRQDNAPFAQETLQTRVFFHYFLDAGFLASSPRLLASSPLARLYLYQLLLCLPQQLPHVPRQGTSAVFQRQKQAQLSIRIYAL